MSPYKNDIIETSFTINHDWFECPNVVMAVAGDISAIARDDDPESPLSTVNRGREIWEVDESAALEDDETIDEYAERVLTELQMRNETISYTRRFMPNIDQDDAVELRYPDLSGIFYVESQSISLGPNAKTNETVYRVY